MALFDRKKFESRVLIRNTLLLLIAMVLLEFYEKEDNSPS